MAEPLIVFVSDMHLSDKKPKCRMDRNWYITQAIYLRRLCGFAQRGRRYKEIGEPLPVLCAGDVFHRWSQSSELVNMVMNNLPKKFGAVAGQHDLPYHSMEQIDKSSFWSLVLAGKLTLLSDDPLKFQMQGKGCKVYGYSWGELDRLNENQLPVKGGRVFNVAVVHRYVWTGPKKVGADWMKDEDHADATYAKYRNHFDLMVFGDNHTPFAYHKKDMTIINNGTFMIRNRDEIGCNPRVSILYDDGSVASHLIKTDDLDEFSDAVESPKGQTQMNFAELERELKTGKTTADFPTLVRRMVQKDSRLPKETKEIITEILEEVENNDHGT